MFNSVTRADKIIAKLADLHPNLQIGQEQAVTGEAFISADISDTYYCFDCEYDENAIDQTIVLSLVVREASYDEMMTSVLDNKELIEGSLETMVFTDFIIVDFSDTTTEPPRRDDKGNYYRLKTWTILTTLKQ